MMRAGCQPNGEHRETLATLLLARTRQFRPHAGFALSASLPEARMHMIVYGDFNCPYSYLASQRVDAAVRAGRAEVEWRAVEHDPRLALTGTRTSSDLERWGRELAEVVGLAGWDEQVPGAPPALVSNTGAAVAACAEAVTDGVQDELRRRFSRRSGYAGGTSAAHTRCGNWSVP
jgi:DSBA-like thioredoxin domain-containing protein